MEPESSPTPDEEVNILPNQHIENIEFDTALNIPGSNKSSEQIELSETDPSLRQIKQDLYNSPSEEMRIYRDEIFQLVKEDKNPELAYTQLKDVFIKNNLPTLAKKFKVFEIKFPKDKITEILNNEKIRVNLSPVLKNAGERRRTAIFYHDLLKTHVYSGDPNLRLYLRSFKECEDALGSLDEYGIGNLTQEERSKVDNLIARTRTLYDNSLLARIKAGDNKLGIESKDVSEFIQSLKYNLNVNEGQRITERIAEMFLYPIGAKDIDELLDIMDREKYKATIRGISTYESISTNGARLNTGDLIKSVESKKIRHILHDGLLSREFLGPLAKSDHTPFDSDFGIIEEEFDFKETIEKSIAHFHSKHNLSPRSVFIVVKDRGQLNKSYLDENPNFDPNRYELIASNFLDKTHVGIRTGLPSTEIDYLVVPNAISNDNKQVEQLFCSIASSDHYIPVLNLEGEVIFTPSMYQEYRSFFNGVEELNGDDMVIEQLNKNEPYYDQIHSLIPQIKSGTYETDKIYAKIENIIKEILANNSITVKENNKLDWSMDGAEIHNIGSTARYTNVPDEYDYDMTIILNFNDFRKAGGLHDQITRKLKPLNDKSHGNITEKYIQIRALQSTGISNSYIDVDVGLRKRSDQEMVSRDLDISSKVLGPHDVISSKLENIRTNYGEEIYFEVLANIVLAKKILKEGNAYKSFEDGGIGGIGVETWILANQGNINKAFASFYEAAHDENGKLVSLDDFKKKYKVINPGMNLKKMEYESFIEKMNVNKRGYVNTINVIRSYFELDKNIAELEVAD